MAYRQSSLVGQARAAEAITANLAVVRTGGSDVALVTALHARRTLPR
jgi:hypothetical protein